MKREFNEVELGCIEAILEQCSVSSYVLTNSMLRVRFKRDSHLNMSDRYLLPLMAGDTFIRVQSVKGQLVLTIAAQ